MVQFLNLIMNYTKKCMVNIMILVNKVKVEMVDQILAVVVVGSGASGSSSGSGASINGNSIFGRSGYDDEEDDDEEKILKGEEEIKMNPI